MSSESEIYIRHTSEDYQQTARSWNYTDGNTDEGVIRKCNWDHGECCDKKSKIRK